MLVTQAMDLSLTTIALSEDACFVGAVLFGLVGPLVLAALGITVVVVWYLKSRMK